MNNKSKFIIGGAVILIIIILYLFLPNFNVDQIIILGNSKFTEEEILQMAQEPLDKNTYLINKRKMEENIIKNPYVENIQIYSQFPDTLVFNVNKRQSLATIKFSGGFIIIDDEGVVLEVKQEMQEIVKPLITGIEVEEVKLGEHIVVTEGIELVSVLDVVSNIRSARLLNNISQIEASDSTNIVLITPQGINVLLGKAENLNEKLLMLNQILIDLHEKQIYTGYVDMRYNSNPVYRKAM